MQITMTRFSGQTLTANRNVDALRLRGSQGTPNNGTLVPIPTVLVPTDYKMSTEKLIAAVTGHPLWYDPSLFHFKDRKRSQKMGRYRFQISKIHTLCKGIIRCAKE
jgi:hypothetical protein